MQTTNEKPEAVIGTDAAATAQYNVQKEMAYFERRADAAAAAGRKYLKEKTEGNPELCRLSFNLTNHVDDLLAGDAYLRGHINGLGVETFGQVMRIVYGTLNAMNEAACAVQPLQ